MAGSNLMDHACFSTLRVHSLTIVIDSSPRAKNHCRATQLQSKLIGVKSPSIRTNMHAKSKFEFQASCGALLFLLVVGAGADSPAPETPYSRAAGAANEFMFVMLPGYCSGHVPQTFEISPADYDAFLTNWRKQTAPRNDLSDSICGKSSIFSRSQVYRDGESLLQQTTYDGQWKAHTTLPVSGWGWGQYTKSGLYRNDGSTTPLWSVQWYAFTVHLSDNGQHLVRMGPWASGGSSLAVAFYDRGKLTKSYSVDDLVADIDHLPHSISHFMWRKEVIFDEQANRLTITTLNDERYVFDTAIGEIIESHHKPLVSYDVVVRQVDGLQVNVKNFETCAGVNLTISQMANGRSAGHNFYGYAVNSRELSSDSEQTIRHLTSYTVPFSALSRIIRTNQYEDTAEHRWTMHIVSGEQLELLTDHDDVVFCGNTRSGESFVAVAEKIAELTFSSNSPDGLIAKILLALRRKAQGTSLHSLLGVPPG